MPKKSNPSTPRSRLAAYGTPSRRGPISVALLVLAIGLVASAILTPIHGDAGTSDDISARSAWNAIHIAQIFAYFALAIGAQAAAGRPGATSGIATSLTFVGFGSALAGLAHIVDGPVRVAMHAQGLGDGATLYEVVMTFAVWMIVPGYIFMGLAGAAYAFQVSRSAGAGWRRTAYGAMFFFAIGSMAGWASELLQIVPGVTFLGLAIGWLWTGVFLMRHLRTAEGASQEGTLPVGRSHPTHATAPRGQQGAVPGGSRAVAHPNPMGPVRTAAGQTTTRGPRTP